MPAELFLVHTGFLEDDEVFTQKLKRVSKLRKQKVDACRGRKDKLRSLAAGLLLEEQMRQNFLDPGLIAEAEGGKLIIPDQTEFYFSLAHSGEYAACVVSDFPVGVDIQQYKPVREGLAKRFFQAQEAALLKKARGNAREELFFRLWTGKESYVKLTGEGLRKNLNSFHVNLEEGTIEDRSRPEQKTYLREYHCLPEYAVTVAGYRNEFARFVKRIYYRL